MFLPAGEIFCKGAAFLKDRVDWLVFSILRGLLLVAERKFPIIIY